MRHLHRQGMLVLLAVIAVGGVVLFLQDSLRADTRPYATTDPLSAVGNPDNLPFCTPITNQAPAADPTATALADPSAAAVCRMPLTAYVLEEAPGQPGHETPGLEAPITSPVPESTSAP